MTRLEEIRQRQESALLALQNSGVEVALDRSFFNDMDYLLSLIAVVRKMGKALEMTVEYCPKSCELGIEPEMIYGHKEAREALTEAERILSKP